MHRQPLLLAVLLVALAPPAASAGVWLELLHAPCWTGRAESLTRDDGFIGEYRGALDCFNKDFNGDGVRTTLSIKAFQPWEYGSVFLYYDITGPFRSALAESARPNERGGFFGGLTVAVSPKRVAEAVRGERLDWGPLADLSLKAELENVATFGALFYYGLIWDLTVPGFEFLSLTTVLRNDTVFRGLDFQVGVAWQAPFDVLGQGLLLTGFLQAGLFGEGAGRGSFAGTKGRRYLFGQPQLLWDVGRAARLPPKRLYLGFEYQVALNRYLIEGKTENVLQGMVRWDI